MNKDLLEIFEETYHKFLRDWLHYLAPWERKPYFDYNPFHAYLGIYQRSPKVIRFGAKWFFDIYSGFVVELYNPRVFFKTPYFYNRVFFNKRPGKRYIFGVYPNKKTELAAILTHVTAPIAQQKHLQTRQMLQKARLYLRRNFPENHFYFNYYVIDLKTLPNYETKEPVLIPWYHILRRVILSGNPNLILTRI